MKSFDAADFYTVKCFPDRRIAAFFQKEPPGFFEGGRHVLKHRDESQKTLVHDIIVQLSFHIRIDAAVNDLMEGIEERMVFKQALIVHMVCERGSAAAVIIEGFL